MFWATLIGPKHVKYNVKDPSIVFTRPDLEFTSKQGRTRKMVGGLTSKLRLSMPQKRLPPKNCGISIDPHMNTNERERKELVGPAHMHLELSKR